jgi:arsenate reductase
MTAAFKAASDETRFRLFRVLALAGEALCLCELVDIVRRPEYAVSRAMRVLRDAGLATEERRGRLAFYTAASDAAVRRLAELVADSDDPSGILAVDVDRLRWRMDLRENGSCVVTYTNGYNPPEYSTHETEVPMKPRVLFICVHNSARSQMAEEFLRRYGGDLFDVESAGLEPGELNPHVVEVLREEGIDISDKDTRAVWDLYRAGRAYAYVITVCSREAEENCPIFPGPVNRLSWPFADPSAISGTREEILSRTREIRNQIRDTVRRFVAEEREKRTDEVEARSR